MKSCAVFRFNPAFGWQVFDYYQRSWSVSQTLVQVTHDKDGKPSLLMLHGTFKQPLQRGRFTKQPHKYLESLS